MRMLKNLLLALVLTISMVSAAFAYPQIVFVPAGNGIYTLQCYNMQNVGSIQFDVKYDKAILTPPEPGMGVTSGSSFSMFTFNTQVPGIIKISALNPTPVSGTVTIATITFPSVKGKVGAGAVRVENLLAYDDKGRLIGVEAVDLGTTPTKDTGTTTPPPDTTNQADQGGTTQTPSGTGGGAPVYLGTVSQQTSGEAGSGGAERGTEKKAPAEPSTPEFQQPPVEAPPAGESGEVAPAPKAPPAKVKLPEYRGVLASFREFSGERTPKTMLALVTAAPPKGIKQEPAIVLADGKTKVKFHIHFPADIDTTPNFALRGAKLLSLKHDGLDWVVEALPKLNVYDVSVTVIVGDAVVEFPLTVAPSLDALVSRGLAMDEKGFGQFLAERGTDKAPKFDLDGDGKRTFVDDYIYTLNYAVRLAKKDQKVR